MSYFTPGGNRLERSAMVVRIARAVASAFEPGRWNTAIATAGSRLR